MDKKKDNINFFERNEEEVCGTICKILFWMTLVFPALFLCSAVHIFQITDINNWCDLHPVSNGSLEVQGSNPFYQKL